MNRQARDVADSILRLRTDLDIEMRSPERKKFEDWYSRNAFYYQENPIGSRDCDLQWRAWKAAVQLILENSIAKAKDNP